MFDGVMLHAMGLSEGQSMYPDNIVYNAWAGSLTVRPTADILVTGRPARRAASLPVLRLLSGPKMGLSPRKGDTMLRYFYRGRNMGIQPLSKCQNLEFCPQICLSGGLLCINFTKLSAFMLVYRWLLNF